MTVFIETCQHLCEWFYFKTEAGAPWTETIKNTGFSPARVDSSVALGSFRDWLNDPANEGILPPHDHAMLFTG